MADAPVTREHTVFQCNAGTRSRQRSTREVLGMDGALSATQEGAEAALLTLHTKFRCEGYSDYVPQ